MFLISNEIFPSKYRISNKKNSCQNMQILDSTCTVCLSGTSTDSTWQSIHSSACPQFPSGPFSAHFYPLFPVGLRWYRPRWYDYDEESPPAIHREYKDTLINEDRLCPMVAVHSWQRVHKKGDGLRLCACCIIW